MESKDARPHRAVYAVPVLGLIIGIGFVHQTHSQVQATLGVTRDVRAPYVLVERAPMPVPAMRVAAAEVVPEPVLEAGPEAEPEAAELADAGAFSLTAAD